MARSAMAGWEERFDDYVERLGDTFLVAERCRLSPQGWRPELEAPERPADYRPRGSSRAPGAAQPGLDRDLAPAPRGGAAAPPAALPLLPADLRATAHARQLMTR